MIDGVLDWERINDETASLLKDVLNSVEPGNDLEISYHFGTQREDWEGSSYDDDWWCISLMDGAKTILKVMNVSLYHLCKDFLSEMKNHQ